jgi:type IV pilus assembly protein PilW
MAVIGFSSSSRTSRLARVRGFSLVELMVALAVGLVVVAALMYTLFAASISGQHGKALVQMSEDASVALSMLREQLSQVGYSQATGVNGAGKFVKAFTAGGVVGCDTPFGNPAAAVSLANLTCAAAGSGAAIAMAYEADASNSVVSGGVPLDCLGNKMPAPVGPVTYYQAFNLFYLKNGSLYCQGNGGGGEQALVENIQDMKIWYGITNDPTVVPVQVGYYAQAAAINPAAAPLTPAYANAVTVRVCVVVRSSVAVAEKINGNWPQYLDCNNVLQQPADGRLYRAFTSTVVLQNMLAL